MKATALIAAAALVCGTAAFAQQSTDRAARGEENARAEQQEHGQASEKMRSGMHRLGEKTRHALHRAGDKVRHVARNDRQHANDTRAMGAGRSDMRDADTARRQRMDEAYANWKAKHDKNG